MFRRKKAQPAAPSSPPEVRHLPMESQLQKQVKEVMTRISRGDVPVTIDTYPDLKRSFERYMKDSSHFPSDTTWAEFVILKAQRGEFQDISRFLMVIYADG